MRIGFDMSEKAWGGYDDDVKRLASKPGVKRVLEIGGGANPALPTNFVESRRLEYFVLDLSSEELAKVPDGYAKVQADITSPDLDFAGGYNLIISKSVAEHLRSGQEFHNNVLSLLTQEGIAFHFFPTFYAPPFVVSRLLPEWLSERVLLLLQPGRKREGKHAKFPSHYSRCREPTSSQIRKVESLGYRVEEYIGFFGYGGYYARVKSLKRVHDRIAAALARHPVPWLTSFAYVVLSKRET